MKQIIAAAGALAACGCGSDQPANPLLSDFDTKHNIAPFADITIDNYREGMLLGMEEQEIIKPAIVEAYEEGILAFGPFAADGFFASGQYKKYDAVLAMYHDQGLAPFKTLTPDGVNFTASLSEVRTSPDHGVAYDIAGEGKADEQSLRNAIYEAIDIVRRRREFEEWSANPLEHFEREKGRDISIKDLPETEHND